MQVDRKLLVWVGVLVGIAAVSFGGYLLLKPDPDPRGTSDRVNDTASGLRWDMYGEAYGAEITLDLDGEGPDLPVTARDYLVTHDGEWAERIVVFDAGAGTIDYEKAAVAVFDDADGELEDGEFVKIAEEYDGVIGSGESSDDDGSFQRVSRVFAGQIAGYVVAGGIVVYEDKDPPIDLEDQADELLASVRTPK